MRTKLTLVAVAGIAAVVALNPGDDTTGPRAGAVDPDLVLTGATIRTMNPAQPTAAAVAITGNRISYVGSEATALGLAGAGTEIRDLGGGAIVPGFGDAHLHAIEAGQNLELCYLPSFKSAAFYVRKVRKCARQQRGSAGSWVRGGGPFVQDMLAQRETARDLLDRAVENRPVVITDGLGHAAFGNSKALRKAGIRANDRDPGGGVYMRERGRLNGVLLENAQNVLLDAAQEPSRKVKRENLRGLRRALGKFAKNGITTVSDAGGYWPRAHDQAWTKAKRRGELTVRASNALFVYPDRRFGRQVAAIRKRRRGFDDPKLRLDQVKIYVDGIVDYGTAALREPYKKRPGWAPGGNRGFTYFSKQALRRYTERFDRMGLGVHFHGWGDRAARLAVGAVAAARAQNPGGPAHRITHGYLIDPAERSRLEEMRIAVDFQLGAEAISPSYAESLKRKIGAADAGKLLEVGLALDSGATVALSSDWDADRLSPLGTVQRSLTRQAGPDQTVPDVATALELVTIRPAEILGFDQITGSIEVGKRADLAVLAADPLGVPADQIGEIKIDLTIFNGKLIFER